MRNMAAKEGVAPANLSKLLDIIKQNGRVYSIDDFTNEERGDRGLPAIETEPGFIKRILEVKG